MDTQRLSHRECVELVTGLGHRHTIRIGVDGRPSVPVVCFVRDGDLLVPTGGDPWVPQIMLDQPVDIELDSEAWTITGMGLAVRLYWEDRLPGPVALRGAFGNGIRIRVARFTGYRLPDAPPIPSQRRAREVRETPAVERVE